ncbi:MAG: NAD(P)H-dependent oxidoreductase subunit E [Clostridia bacterium]|nr:NAD(P)H-dependent oxidoreductase subunit E [Clostridia bacterium]
MACGMKSNENILEQALDLQKQHGWVTPEDVKEIAAAKGIPVSKAYETLSFYSMILLKKPADVRVEVCRGTSCYIAEGTDLLDELRRITGCNVGERSDDGKYQVEYCECLGRCDTAPNIVVNGKLHTAVTKESLSEIL